MARPGFTHIPLQRKKETVRHISQVNPSDRSVSALLHTLILRPYISLRRAQTAESSLSAKTAIHAGRKNQSHATNALLLISSLFLSHPLYFRRRNTPCSLPLGDTSVDQSASQQQSLTDASYVLWLWRGHLRSWPSFLYSQLRHMTDDKTSCEEQESDDGNRFNVSQSVD